MVNYKHDTYQKLLMDTKEIKRLNLLLLIEYLDNQIQYILYYYYNWYSSYIFIYNIHFNI